MALKDPYELLGVTRAASADEIRTAYRKLAKQHHPDLNPGNAAAEARFKEISVAYDLLSDPEKRARFDRGEIDAAGTEQPDFMRPGHAGYRRYAEGAEGAKYHAETGNFDDLGGIFADLFGRGGARPDGASEGGIRMRGPDRQYRLAVDFLDAARGAKQRLELAPGQSLDVTIPAGLKDGQVLRLQGQGEPGFGGGPPGDALIEVAVRPHRFFRREGNDILVEVPVTLKEAVLGGKITVPTLGGPVAMTVPRGSEGGTVLRLKGRGIAAAGGHGDQLVTLKLVFGAKPDAALSQFLEGWQPAEAEDPRRAMGAP